MTESTTSAVDTEKTLSWREWLEQFGPRLLLFSRQQTRSQEDAQDVLQEALIKLAAKVGDGSFQGGQEAWVPYVYASIRRTAIDHGRKNDRRSRREGIVVHDEEVRNPVEDPWFDESEVDDEVRGMLESFLKQIPEKFAEVIHLKVWGELTFAEIGQALDISANTAASRYRYGIDALRKKIEVVKNRGEF